jgi:alpha-glucan, water dikinase
VRFQEINPHQAITKSKSSQLLLLLYSEGGKNIRDPPEP